jgi:ATP-binding cassette, subfamily B, bacterial HlyB/CyaB
MNIKVDTGLQSVILFAKLHDLAITKEFLEFTKYTTDENFFDLDDIKRSFKNLNLKSKILHTEKLELLNKFQLPVMAKLKNGQYIIIVRADEEKVLLQNPSKKQPEILKLKDFREIFDNTFILITKRFSLKNKLNKFDFSWFLAEVVKYKKILFECLIASCFIQLMSLLTPLFFQVTVDKVLIHHGITTLDVIILAMVLVSIFEVLITGLRYYVLTYATNKIDVTLSSNMFRHLMSLPISFFNARQVGTTIEKIKQVDVVRQFLTGSALMSVLDLSFTFVFFAVMFYLAPNLTWIVLGSIPLYIIISLAFTPMLRKRLNEQFEKGALKQSFLVECINGIETVKSSAIENKSYSKWDNKVASYIHSSFKAGNLGNILQQISSLISKITSCLTLFFGAKLVMDGSLTVGQFIAFNMLAGRVIAPILRITQLWQEFNQVGIAVEKLGDILNQQKEQTNASSALNIKNGNIRFENVNFYYELNGKNILSNINLEIKTGQIVGIVGQSGSGKSTLAKLLQRFYIPNEGRIYIDDIDISLTDPFYLRNQIGIVLQTSFLFNQTIRENIALKNPAVSLDKVVECAKIAGAHDFITELENGYDTLIEENGANLSGGQKQRIAIARSLISDPKILIFDEATSALDYQSEKIIQENMERICKNRTVIIIAHRLSTVRNSDCIVVMDKGKIIEQGNHAQLVAKKGNYYNLTQIQEGIR